MPIHTTICWNWAAWSGFKTEKAVACGNVHQLSETAKGDIDAYEPLVTHYMQYTAGEARGLKQRSTKAMCLFWLFPWSDLLPPSIPQTCSHKRYTGNNYGSWSGIQRKKSNDKEGPGERSRREWIMKKDNAIESDKVLIQLDHKCLGLTRTPFLWLQRFSHSKIADWQEYKCPPPACM